MISITLPSLHPETLVACLQNLDASTFGDFEVIVVGPHEPRVGLQRGTLVYLHEPPEEARGIAAAHEKAFAAATGDFVFAYADDHLMEGGWDHVVLREFHKMNDNRLIALGVRETSPHDAIHTSFGRYYANFPLMRRDDVHIVGGWLCGKFKVGFSDTDLSLRVRHAGGKVRWTNARPLRPTQQNARPVKPNHALMLREDEELLLHRWPDFAAIWTPDLKRNPERHPGQDFNLSFVPEDCPRLVGNNTVYCPDPREFWEERVRALA